MPSPRKVQGERLELLAVVRGLEALDQPSRVTLVTPSKYVHRGLLYGLEEWRTNGWSWEHFGQMVPVKNRDLWQRLDRALGFHELEFQPWRLDTPLGEKNSLSSAEPSAGLQTSAMEIANMPIWPSCWKSKSTKQRSATGRGSSGRRRAMVG